MSASGTTCRDAYAHGSTAGASTHRTLPSVGPVADDVVWLLVAACALAALPAALTLANLRALRAPAEGELAPGKVSVLIPARDEASRIGAAIESVLANVGADIELLVLDDDSSDATAAIVAGFAARDPRVRLLRGTGPAPGLWGKPAACARLAEASTGDWLIFLDADVQLAPRALVRIVCTLADSPSALLSGVPRQHTESLSEKLLVPLIHFVLLGFLPLSAMRRSRHPRFGVACGQLLACERSAYFASGGHAGVADRVHDAMALARAFRRAGHTTDLSDFTGIATCRMYRSCRETVAGFAKNAHEGLGSAGGIVPWTVLLAGGHTSWLAALPVAFADPRLTLLTLTAALFSTAPRLLLAYRFRQSRVGALLHAFGVGTLVLIQWYALVRRIGGCPVPWKRRTPHN